MPKQSYNAETHYLFLWLISFSKRKINMFDSHISYMFVVVNKTFGK